jgi:hypothetical protein
VGEGPAHIVPKGHTQGPVLCCLSGYRGEREICYSSIRANPVLADYGGKLGGTLLLFPRGTPITFFYIFWRTARNSVLATEYTQSGNGRFLA